MVVLICLCALLFAAPSALLAQGRSAAEAARPDSSPIIRFPPDPACTTGRISYVFIDNHSIFDTSDPELDRRFAWVYRAANALHFQTKQGVIRRELLFAPGDCYDPFLVAETERLLRTYDFLARVDVFGVPQPDGSYHVIVDTQDDWSTRLDVRLRINGDLSLQGLHLQEENLLGSGQSLGLFYFERTVNRDYGISYFNPQLARTRWDLTTSVGKSRAGTVIREEVAYPWIGEVSHWAGRESFSRDDRYFDYVRQHPGGSNDNILVPVREKSFDLAAIRRLGRPTNMALLGAGISARRLTYPGVISFAPLGHFDQRMPADATITSIVHGQMREIDVVRASLLLGYRNIWWIKRRGLDTMKGEQDIPLGAEFGTALGRSLPGISNDNDLYTTFTLYTGVQADDALFIARLRADARRDLKAPLGSPEWQDVYGEGELLTYWQPPSMPNHTLFFRAWAADGWNTRTPFQLTLGGERAVRGYDIDRFPGGRRTVFTAEDRFYLGWPLRDVMDMGGTVFADVGRVRPGDSPFGVDSGWRASLGFGLRASLPAGSRTTYRLDFAWPTDGFRPGRFRVLLSLGELLGIANTEPEPQLLRSRPEGVAGRLFEFRNN